MILKIYFWVDKNHKKKWTKKYKFYMNIKNINIIKFNLYKI